MSKKCKIPSNNSILKFAEQCEKNKIWKKYGKLGSGLYGYAYITCLLDNCEYVLKIQKNTNVFVNEVECMYNLRGNIGIPSIYTAWTCQGYGYFVMDRLYNCDITPINMYKKLKYILNTMLYNGWLYVDIHKNNVKCNSTGKKLYLIDFGWSVRRKNCDFNISYPEHPLSIKLGFSCTWYFLKLIQTWNLEKNFNPRKTKGQRVAYTLAKNKFMNEYKKLQNLS